MNAVGIVIAAEFVQFPLQVKRVPEEGTVEIFAAKGTDQAFHKRMRNRRVRNCLDFVDFEHAQVGKPAMKTKQWIMVGADVLGNGWSAMA